MKKVLLFLFVIMFAAGCTTLTPAKTQEFLTHTQELSGKLDILQEVSTSNAEALRDIGVVNDETLIKVAKVNEEIDRLQPQITAVTDKVITTPLTGEVVQDWIALAAAGNAASAPYNPWAVPLGGVISLAGIIAAGIFNRKKKVAEAKYRAHKTGTEKTVKGLRVLNKEMIDAAIVEDSLYENIGEARARNGV